jgi:hypothetical protein
VRVVVPLFVKRPEPREASEYVILSSPQPSPGGVSW